MIANSPPPSTSDPVTVEPRYLPLYLYLNDRRAEVVVLTFEEIERLLGFPLPDLARTVRAWWATPGHDGAASPQSSSWTQANMTAAPFFSAGTVVFERPSQFV